MLEIAKLKNKVARQETKHQKCNYFSKTHWAHTTVFVKEIKKKTYTTRVFIVSI